MVKKLSLLMVLLCVGWSLMAATPKRFTLVIDAGHGGHDTGARGVFSQEKDINLSVALRFGKLIESNCPDVKVIYTRKDDRFVTLHERAAIANRNKADLFISVHTNAVARGHTVQGFQVYTLGMHRAKDNLDVAMRENSVISLEKDYEQTYQGFDPKSSESYIMFEFIQSANMERSIELARFIQRSVCSNVGRNDKGVHQAGFLVLRETSMPSCLIELGFITTPEEENFLNTEEGQASMAEAFYKAFVKYRKKYEPQWTVPTRETKPISIAPAVTKKPAIGAQPKKVQPVAVPVIPAPQKPKETTKEQAPDKQAAPAPQPQLPPEAQAAIKGVVPVFKIQVFAINRQLHHDSEQFKGHKRGGQFRRGRPLQVHHRSQHQLQRYHQTEKKAGRRLPQLLHHCLRWRQADEYLAGHCGLPPKCEEEVSTLTTTARQCDTDSLLKENQNKWKKSILATK